MRSEKGVLDGFRAFERLFPIIYAFNILKNYIKVKKLNVISWGFGVLGFCCLGC